MSIPQGMKQGDKLVVEVEVDTKTFLGVLKGSKIVELSGELGEKVLGNAKKRTVRNRIEGRHGGEGAEAGRNARTRAGVARAKVDMRTVATALEAYAMDKGRYPKTLAPHLTTPIAYITQIPADPFAQPEKPLQYLPNESRSAWTLFSVGPDGVSQEAKLLFDPTNGTVSGGDVIRRK